MKEASNLSKFLLVFNLSQELEHMASLLSQAIVNENENSQVCMIQAFFSSDYA
jgi:hypothetical protein